MCRYFVRLWLPQDALDTVALAHKIFKAKRHLTILPKSMLARSMTARPRTRPCIPGARAHPALTGSLRERREGGAAIPSARRAGTGGAGEGGSCRFLHKHKPPVGARASV